MGKKRNYHTIRYGQKDGEIKFGHLHKDDVQSELYWLDLDMTIDTT